MLVFPKKGTSLLPRRFLPQLVVFLSEEKEQGGGFNKNLKKNYSQNTKNKCLLFLLLSIKIPLMNKKGSKKNVLL